MNKAAYRESFKGLTLNQTIAKFQSETNTEEEKTRLTQVVLEDVTAMIAGNGATMNADTENSICIMMTGWGFSYSETFKLQHSL